MESTWDWVDAFSSTINDEPDAKGPKGPPEDTNHTMEQVFAVIGLSGMSLIIIMALLAITLSKDSLSKFNLQIHSGTGRVLFLLFVTAMAFNFSNIAIFAELILVEIDDYGAAYEQIVISRFLYDCGKYCMSTFFIFRLFVIFKKTPALRVEAWKCWLLVALLTGAWCSCAWGTIGFLLDFANPSAEKAIAQYSVIAVLDLIVTVYYFAKFLSIIISQAEVQQEAPSRSSSSVHVQTTSSSMDLEGNGTKSEGKGTKSEGRSPKTDGINVTVNQDLVDVVAKSTLLNLIGMSSSCMLIGYLIYLVETRTIDPMFGVGLRCIDAMINTLCIFLVFGFSAKYYDFGCKCCHFGMSRCCNKVAESMVRRKNVKENMSVALELGSTSSTSPR